MVGIALGELLQPLPAEEELDLHRLLAPERAVIVERRDPVGGPHVVRPALSGDPRDEIQYRGLGLPIIP